MMMRVGYWKGKTGPDAIGWKGGRYKDKEGYIRVYNPDHPKADVNSIVHEHILVAEKTLGKHLPPGAQVHHVNEDGIDNIPGNLVICQDRAYHNLLHRRMKALKACGHANWRKCVFCKRYDDPINLIIDKYRHVYHKNCSNLYQANRRKKIQEVM